MNKMCLIDPDNRQRNRYVMALLIALLILIVGSSCNPQKRMARLMDKHPGIAAVECEARYPIVEVVRDTILQVDTALLTEYESELSELTKTLDSLIAKKCDPQIIEKVQTIFQNKPCPPAPVKVITVEKESTAKLRIVRDSCQKLTSQVLTLQKKLKSKATALRKARKQRNGWIFVSIILALWVTRRLWLRAFKII